MTPGKIQFAEANGTFVLKFIGDVRLTLSTILDKKLEMILKQPEINSVIIDLSETRAIDSTSLGLLARLSIQAKIQLGMVPTILSPDDDINRTLLGMGFDQIFVIVRESEKSSAPVVLHDLPYDDENSDEEVMDKVLTAHKVLMKMNDRNRQEFRSLVQRLEQDRVITVTRA